MPQKLLKNLKHTKFISDVIRQNESDLANNNFEVKPIYFLFCKTFETACISGTNNHFSWGCLLNIAVKMVNTAM